MDSSHQLADSLCLLTGEEHKKNTNHKGMLTDLLEEALTLPRRYGTSEFIIMYFFTMLPTQFHRLAAETCINPRFTLQFCYHVFRPATSHHYHQWQAKATRCGCFRATKQARQNHWWKCRWGKKPNDRVLFLCCNPPLLEIKSCTTTFGAHSFEYQ